MIVTAPNKWVVNIQTGEAMENDFQPVVGHRFQFRTQPTEWWDGVISGEVLDVDARNRVSANWPNKASSKSYA